MARSCGTTFARRKTCPAASPVRPSPDEAHALGLDVSRAAEERMGGAIGAERWRAENAGAIAAYDCRIATEGVPLAGFRKF
jgi:antitoxin CcdA